MTGMLAARMSFESGFRPELLLLATVAVGLVLLGYGAMIRWRRRPAATGSTEAFVLGLAALGWAAVAAASPALRSPGALLGPLVGLCVATTVVFYRLVYRYLGSGRMLSLLGLRVLGVAILLGMLFRPVFSFTPDADDRPLLAVLLDASKSMSVQDSPQRPSRYVQALRACQADLPTVAEQFRVALYRFDERLQAAESIDGLYDRSPDGEATDLAAAIAEAPQRHPEATPFGLVIISDGNHNGPGDVTAASERSPSPVYTVAVGGTEIQAEQVRDLSVAAVDAPDQTAANNRCEITAHIAAVGRIQRLAKVRLLEGTTVLDTQEADLSGSLPSVPVALSFTPNVTGRKVLTVEVGVDPDGELITANNRHRVHLLVTDPKIKLLYVEGTTRPEYKFLRRSLDQDPNIELLSVVQVRQPKWLLSGTVGGQRPDDFPSSADQFAAFLGQFDVVMLGDVHAVQLTPDRMTAIREAVRNGKGVLVIGGQHNLGPGQYAGSPLADVLPVRVGGTRLPEGRDRQDATPFVPALTAAGTGHPIFAGLAEFFDPDAPASDALPALAGCVIVDGPKAGAEVLAEDPAARHPVSDTPLVVLAVQQYGSGRAAVFTADTTWRWYLRRRALGQDSPYHRFWGQLIRWLSGIDARPQGQEPTIRLNIPRSYYRPGESVEMTAQVRDPQGKPLSQTELTATVSVDARPTPVTLSADQAVPGKYTGSFEPTASGEHTIAVVAELPDDRSIRDEMTFEVGKPSAELDRLAVNRELLQTIARSGKGQCVNLGGLGDLLGRLVAVRRQQQPAQAGVEFRFFGHPGGFFLLFIALVTVEWLLRRRWQLQ